MKLGKTLLILSAISTSLVFTSSCQPGENTNIEIDENQKAITMVGNALENEIRVDISSDEKVVGNGVVGLYAIKSYEYFSEETNLETHFTQGVSTSIVDFSKIEESNKRGEYTLGTTTSITFNRYIEEENGSIYDRLYEKYYLIHEGNIIKGPMYITNVESKVTTSPTLNNQSKKGLFCEANDYSLSNYEDLGCSHSTINIDLVDFLAPNEDENGNELDSPINAYTYKLGGKTYSFRKSAVDKLDKYVKGYYEKGSTISCILIARDYSDWSEYPKAFTYDVTQGQIMGFNTSNRVGSDYFIATMEFLNDHYSKNNYEFGYISNYVIGNEIDYSNSYYRISNDLIDLKYYVEEYSRTLRLANLACKKFNKDVTVTVPFTQWWNVRPVSLNKNVYTPRKVFDYLNEKTKFEGDYNWNIAPHTYVFGLGQTQVYYFDTVAGINAYDSLTNAGGSLTNNIDTTGALTFSNIELLDNYLKEENNLVNGKTRKIFLTESGVSSSTGDIKEDKYQAGYIASIYYKLCQLDTVECWNYYREEDHSNEGNCRFGLLYSDCYTKKEAYNVYKYIDTEYSKQISSPYLKYISYAKNGKMYSYEDGITSYDDTLDVFDTKLLSKIDYSKVEKREASEVDEYVNDKIDLNDVIFENKSYVYDGEEHSLAAYNLPSGVTVTYSTNNKLTEVGEEKVTASFYKDEELVGTRVRTLKVAYLVTNKEVYEEGEDIYVTVSNKVDNINTSSWFGTYEYDLVPGKDNTENISTYYTYNNTGNDNYIRTYKVQDGVYQSAKSNLTLGEYKIYYFPDGSYSYLENSIATIKIIKEGEPTKEKPLKDIEFSDKTVSDRSEELTISGTLPEGYSVVYKNNTVGVNEEANACAIFYKGEREIERRYALISYINENEPLLTTDKTTYKFGEDIMVKAISNGDSWWVGLYLETDSVETDYSLYWYYVASYSNKWVNIKEQEQNPTRPNYDSLKDLNPGNYKLVLFNSGGYTIETTLNIVITD